MALEESVLTREDIETLLTLEYGIHLVNHSQLSFGTANCYKIICAEGEFFLKEFFQDSIKNYFSSMLTIMNLKISS